MNCFGLFLPKTWLVLVKQPLLGLPAFVAVTLGWLIDRLIRPSSTVVAGDNGELLLGRVIASILVVVLPAIVWGIALTVTTALARDAWLGGVVDLQTIMFSVRIGLGRSISFIGVLATIQLILAVLLPFAGFFTDLLTAVIVFSCAFALPAHVIGRLPCIAAFQTSIHSAFRRPQYVAIALAIPAIVIFLAFLTSLLLGNSPLIGSLCSALLLSEVIAFTIAHIVAIYECEEYASDGPRVSGVRALLGGTFQDPSASDHQTKKDLD